MVHRWVQWGQGSVFLNAEGCTVAATEICPLSLPCQACSYRENSQDGPPYPGHGAEWWQR